MRADDSVVVDGTELSLVMAIPVLKNLCQDPMAGEDKQPPYAEGVL